MLHTLLSRFPPPTWLRTEVVGRLSLFCNHLLQQEPEAQQRLQRQAGRSIHLKWQQIEVLALITPAGLLDVRPYDTSSQATTQGHKAPDLLIEIKENSSSALLGTLMKGDKPSVHIAGDVQLAAEINWLSQNLRWDIEEDASRLLGDAAAHRLVSIGRGALEAVRGFIRSAPFSGSSSGSSSGSASGSDSGSASNSSTASSPTPNPQAAPYGKPVTGEL